MRYKFFFSTILSLSVMSVVMANPIQPCSSQAITVANNQYLQEISKYTIAFNNINNHEAVAELNKIQPTNSFKKKHAKEIIKFNQSNYQPSQEFCDDAYKNLSELNQQIIETVQRHDIDKTISP